MYQQTYQIYKEEIEVAFYLYKDNSGVYHVKYSEIKNSNLLVDELKYLFVENTKDYCLLSTFIFELLNANNNEEGYRYRNVVDSIIDRLCNG